MGVPRRPEKRGETRRGLVFRDAQGRGLGDRLHWIVAYHAMRRGDTLSQLEIARRVSQTLGDGSSYSQATVGGWLSNLWVPPTRVIDALARVFGCDPGWLAFGQSTEARRPDIKLAEEQRLEGAARVADVVHRTLEERLREPRPLEPPDEERPHETKRRPKRA